MALPRAVQAIGDAAEAAAVQSGIKKGVPGAQAAEKLPVSVPAASGNDPENYRERFAGLTRTHQEYKQTTDAAMADLRSSLAISQQTITQLQSQVQSLTAQAQAAPANTVTTASSDDKAGFDKWFSQLPQKIRDEYDESYLKDQYDIQTIGKQYQSDSEGMSVLQQEINELKQYQAKTAGQLYEEAMDAAFPNDGWIKLASGSDWNDFCNQTVSPVDTRTYGKIVKQGSDSHNAATVTWVLRQYEKYLTGLNGGTATANPVEGLLTPDGSGGGTGNPISEINAQAGTFTLSQVNAFYADRTKGKYTPEEAASMERQIEAAHAAGKIIQG